VGRYLLQIQLSVLQLFKQSIIFLSLQLMPKTHLTSFILVFLFANLFWFRKLLVWAKLILNFNFQISKFLLFFLLFQFWFQLFFQLFLAGQVRRNHRFVGFPTFFSILILHFPFLNLCSFMQLQF
jgi:hypothetical protein